MCPYWIFSSSYSLIDKKRVEQAQMLMTRRQLWRCCRSKYRFLKAGKRGDQLGSTRSLCFLKAFLGSDLYLDVIWWNGCILGAERGIQTPRERPRSPRRWPPLIDSTLRLLEAVPSAEASKKSAAWGRSVLFFRAGWIIKNGSFWESTSWSEKNKVKTSW